VPRHQAAPGPAAPPRPTKNRDNQNGERHFPLILTTGR
jgi:hypothetical protein